MDEAIGRYLEVVTGEGIASGSEVQTAFKLNHFAAMAMRRGFPLPAALSRPGGRSGFIDHVSLLHRAPVQDSTERTARYDEAFMVSQAANESDAARGVLEMAARFASGENELALRVRE